VSCRPGRCHSRQRCNQTARHALPCVIVRIHRCLLGQHVLVRPGEQIILNSNSTPSESQPAFLYYLQVPAESVALGQHVLV
jgi:hypothetical protein